MGSYASLSGGSPADALEDFTGGVPEYIELKRVALEQRPTLFKILQTYSSRTSLMCASIRVYFILVCKRVNTSKYEYLCFLVLIY